MGIDRDDRRAEVRAAVGRLAAYQADQNSNADTNEVPVEVTNDMIAPSILAFLSEESLGGEGIREKELVYA